MASSPKSEPPSKNFWLWACTEFSYFTLHTVNHNLINPVNCRYGPLVRHWTMRYEAKHAYFKSLAHTLGNFANLPLSLAIRHQCYLQNIPNKNEIVTGPGNIYSIQGLFRIFLPPLESPTLDFRAFVIKPKLDRSLNQFGRKITIK